MDFESITSFISNNPAIIVAAVVIGGLVISGAVKLRRMMHVERNGIVGTAVVKRLSETGRIRNRTPEIVLELKVSLPGFAPYNIEKRSNVPMIYYPRIQPGMTIEVITDRDKFYDPEYLGLRFHDGVSG